MVSHLVTVHPFQSERDKYELGGATNHDSPLPTRPFALLTELFSGWVPPEQRCIAPSSGSVV